MQYSTFVLINEPFLNFPFLDNLNEGGGGSMWRHGDVKQRNNRALGPPRPGWCYDCCRWYHKKRFEHQCAHVNQIKPRSHCVQSREQSHVGWFGGWKKCNYCCEVWRLGKCGVYPWDKGCLNGPCVYVNDISGLWCQGQAILATLFPLSPI